jgi:hypothetical protein
MGPRGEPPARCLQQKHQQDRDANAVERPTARACGYRRPSKARAPDRAICLAEIRDNPAAQFERPEVASDISEFPAAGNWHALVVAHGGPS